MINWIRRRVTHTYYAIREIITWFSLRKIIKENKKSELWKRYGLKAGWVNQIYLVVNLRKEDMGKDEITQRMAIMNKLEPINSYLNSLDLGDFVYPEINKYPNSRSWIVVYWPLFKYFSMTRLIFWIIGISTFIYLNNKYYIIQNIKVFLSQWL